jgi:GNAT superfamily N-acetyltransferase
VGITGPSLTPPVPIDESHDTTSFNCGEETLGRWLRERALKAEGTHSARTYVVCDGSTVVGYYCLSTGAVVRASAAKSLQRNMPAPLPVMVLGRLAIDQQYQGHGIGQALLRDAILRTLAVSGQVGVVALLAHALNEQAKQFYLRYEFIQSPLEPLTMMLPLRKAIQELRANPVN